MLTLTTAQHLTQMLTKKRLYANVNIAITKKLVNGDDLSRTQQAYLNKQIKAHINAK